MAVLILHPDPPERPLPVSAAREANLNPDNRAAVRVLIVEDDFFVGAELEQRLREAGFSVIGIAATSVEALSLADSEKPTLAIMDVRLADERDGVDTAIEMFVRFGVRSIFATAYAHQELKDKAVRAEPIAWLQKPYTADAVIAEIVTAGFNPGN